MVAQLADHLVSSLHFFHVRVLIKVFEPLESNDRFSYLVPQFEHELFLLRDDKIIAFLCHQKLVQFSPSFINFHAVLMERGIESNEFEGLLQSDWFFLQRKAVIKDGFSFAFLLVVVII